MASTCFNRWVKVQNSKGMQKWRNEGPAPDGACPSCPNMGYPADGYWDGFTAACLNGAIVQRVADGNGGIRYGEELRAIGTPQATQACNGNYYIGGPPGIEQYF